MTQRTSTPADNPISRTLNNSVATAGNYSGGVVDAAGKSASDNGRGVGTSIINASSSTGGSASDYGIAVKDWTKASGPRTQTARNPLGTRGGSYEGKEMAMGAGSKSGTGGKETAGNPLGL